MVHYFKLVGHSRFYAYYNGRTIELAVSDFKTEVSLHTYKLFSTDDYPPIYEPIGADTFRAALDRVNVNILPELKTISELTKWANN